MTRRTVLVGAAGLLLLVVAAVSVVRYVPGDQIAVIRRGEAVRQVPPGFVLVNPLLDKLERIPARSFEIGGIATVRSTDGFTVRLPFTAQVLLDAPRFQQAVGDLGQQDAQARARAILEDVVSAWGSTHPAANFLLRDLNESAAVSARVACSPGGILVQSLVLQEPDRDLYLFVAEDALSRGDPKNRMPLIESGLERYPGDGRLLTARGMLREAADDWPAAEADYLAALQAAPGLDAPLGRLFLGLRMRGEVPRLEKLLLDGLAANPDSAKIRSWLALTYVGEGRQAEALQQLEEARRRAPRDEVTLTNLGGVLQQIGRYDEAAEVYKEALELNPTDQRLLFNLGSAELMLGHLAEARSALERAREMGRPSPRLHNTLAEVYQQLGMRDQALAELMASYEADPEQSGLREAIASLGGSIPE